MPSPLKPSDFKDTLVDPDDSLGTAIQKHLKFWFLFFIWYWHYYKADGTFTPEMVADLCKVRPTCNPVPETTTP